MYFLLNVNLFAGLVNNKIEDESLELALKGTGIYGFSSNVRLFGLGVIYYIDSGFLLLRHAVVV